jgi:hypothetical protein
VWVWYDLIPVLSATGRVGRLMKVYEEDEKKETGRKYFISPVYRASHNLVKFFDVLKLRHVKR